MTAFKLRDTIAYARYTINENLSQGTRLTVAWPDGSEVSCVVIGHDEDNHSICTPR